MKKLFLSLGLSGLTLAASAQMRDRVAPGPGSQPQAASTAELTRQMATRLQLNEAQYIRLRTVNHIKLARQEDIQWQYPEPAARQAKLLELEAQYEQECRRILTPSQLSLMQDEPKQPVLPAPESGNGLG